jgi:sulfite exporter TauE/SafE
VIDPVFLLAAFLTGLAGAGHCAGMCGGIAGALAHAVPAGQRSPTVLLAFSAGRLAMYSLLGLLVGTIAGVLAPADFAAAMITGRLLAAAVMIAIGLYLLRLANTLLWIESAGARVWRHLAPLARRLLPVTSLPRAVAVGALWGLLPCGLVYGALLYAGTAGGPAQGAAVMLAFGAGTLPAILGLGLAAVWVSRYASQIRFASGLLMLVWGGWTLLSTLLALPAILDGTCRSPGDVFAYAISLLMQVNEV